MLGHWILKDSPRNFGLSGYGLSLLAKENNKLEWPNTSLNKFCYQFRAENLSGQILSHDNFSFGLMGLKNGKQIIYAKNGNTLYRADDKYATNSGEWMVEYTKEDWADKSHTITLWHDGKTIYKNGTNPLILKGPITLSKNVGEIKLFESSPLNDNFSLPNMLFGASGGLGSGFSLILGSVYNHGTGLNMAMGAFSGITGDCFLLDESGALLLDELGDYLLSETCPGTGTFGAFFGGFDMFISGQAIAASSIPLYLQNSSTTYSLGSGIPLILGNSDNILTKSIDLTLYSTYINIGTGVNLFIDNADGLNDGYVPISSGIPLFIQRNENTYCDLFISGGYMPISGSTNLYLNANTYPISGNTNLVISGKDFSTGTIDLYSAGY